jgi:hypothetical protein
VSFLFKREQDDATLSSTAQQVIISMRNGLSESEAIAQHGVTREEFRAWKRDKHFRAALRAGLKAGIYKPFVDVALVEEVEREVREESLQPRL